jgi:hypothetical protein
MEVFSFAFSGTQQRNTKHSTPVQRVQPQIKSTQEQSEVAQTQTEAVTAIKRQMSKMDEPITSTAAQRAVPARDGDKAANTGFGGANVVATGSAVSAASGGPVSVVPPIQKMPPKSLPNLQPKPAMAVTQTMGVHRPAQILFQETQSVMNQAHLAQISHVFQLNNSQKSCPQHRPIAPKPHAVYQHRPVLPQPPIPQNQTTQENQVVRSELTSPKTPLTPVMVKKPDFPFPPAVSAASSPQKPTARTSVMSVVDRQGKGVRPMTPGTFVREYQKMKREFQRIEAMLTIKERERKQLLFMKSRMSLLIEKMENKLRSLPVNYSSKLVPLLPNGNVDQANTSKKVDELTAASGSGPPPAHVKEPFSQSISRTPDLKTAHSNKISTVPRHLIFMEKELEPKEKPTIISGKKLPQPVREQPRVTTEIIQSHNPEYGRKEEEGRHPSAWKRYANNIGQEGCMVHPVPKEHGPNKHSQDLPTKRTPFEIIDLTTEIPAVVKSVHQNQSNQGSSDTDIPSKTYPEKEKEQRIQQLLHDVQVKRATGNASGPRHATSQMDFGSAPALYSPNVGGPPALVPANMTPSRSTGHGHQNTDPRAPQVQRSMDSSRGTCTIRDSGRPIYTSSQIQQATAPPQYTTGTNLSIGLPRLSGYNPPYANHSVGETIKIRNPMEQSPGPTTTSRAPNAYVNAKSASATNREPSQYNPSPGMSTATMYGPTSMGGQQPAFGVPSSPNLPTDRPGSIPPANTLDKSRAYYSSAPTTASDPAPAASPLRQSANAPSASPVRDPTRRPSFPGTPVHTIDLATSNNASNVANAQGTDMNDKMKMKKKFPKRSTPMHISQPHPMALQPGQFYRGQSPMMTMDPRAQLSMQAPRLLGPDQRSPHEMYMAHQTEMMPGMIQMSPRAQMMHPVRPPGPPKQQIIGFGEQPSGQAVQDPSATYRHRDFAQHQRMMQTSMGMMPPQQQTPRVQAARMPGQAMIMQPQPHQVNHQVIDGKKIGQ